MRTTDMADVLRSAGLKVVEVSGWKTRGHGTLNSVSAIICHHTAGPASGNFPSLDTVLNGRPGLDGPLAQLGLARDGTWYVIASGISWHAGATQYTWQNNWNAIGVEAEAQGTGAAGDWPKAQMDSYARGVAALAKAFGVPNSRVLGHKEVASAKPGERPNGRKIDPSFNMDTFRAAVANPKTLQEDEMSEAAERQIDELHAKLLRKFADGDHEIDVVEGMRRDLIVDRRTEADVNTLVATTRAQAAAIQTLSKSVGVDPAKVIAAVESAVRDALPATITVDLEN